MSEERGRKLLQLTTVHSREDTRIRLKHCATLAEAFPGALELVVADGLGNAANGTLAITDLGALRSSRVARAWLGFRRGLGRVWRRRPFILHFHDPELIPVGLVAKLFGTRVIYDVHEDVPDQIRGRTDIPRHLKPVLASGARIAGWLGNCFFDAIVAATPRIAARFSPRKTVVVQNFPLLSELVPPDPRPYANRPAAFVYVGAISHARGAVEMVEAIGSLESSWNATLELAGRFSPPELESQVRRSRGFERTRLYGWLNRAEVASLLGRARAGLVLFHPIPNHVVAQPNKLFEYMSAGLPVIASDFPLWRQIVETAGCGLLVNPEDPQAIAGAMRWMLEHPDEARAMGERGREAVVARFNWTSEGQKLIDLYKRLLGARVQACVGAAE